MTLNFLIVHCNTPRFTECLIKSINRYHSNCNIYVFDNSNKAPLTYWQENIIYLDNTKGEIIDFDEWLKKYPDHQEVTYSANHCYTIETCLELINEPLILLDSDALLKADVSSLAEDDTLAYVGEEHYTIGQHCSRVYPMICYVNPKVLKKYGVHYFDDRYMAQLGHRTKVFYDTGHMLARNADKLPHRNIKMSDYIEHYGGGSYEKEVFDRIQGADKITPEKWLRKYKKYWGEPNKKVIYTCITGSYDTLMEPLFEDVEDWDFVCFTDETDRLKSDVWDIKQLPKECEDLIMVKKQRYVKTHPHLLFPQYEISLYVDANVLLKKNPTPLLEECVHSVAILQHPERYCIYDVADKVLKTRKDKPEIVKPQIERYKAEGFPAKYGLTQTNIVIRKHNEEDCIRLMEDWWTEIENGSHRDQLSLHYAQWKNGGIPIDILPTALNDCDYFLWKKTHIRDTKITHTPRKVITNNLHHTLKKVTRYRPAENFSTPLKRFLF